MTKIKDLVTVLADNALSFFPVDSERYELTNAVTVVTYGDNISAMIPSYEHANWRINLWLKGTDEVIRLSATAFAITMFHPELTFRDLTVDRANRVKATLTLDPKHLARLLGWTPSRVNAFVCDLLWKQLARYLRHEMSKVSGSSLGLEGYP